jgi:hypothetical protein
LAGLNLTDLPALSKVLQLILQFNPNMATTWTDDKNIQLINYFSENIFLFDITTFDYRNRDKRRISLEKLGKDLDVSGK